MSDTSKVPTWLIGRLAALVVVAGLGGGAFIAGQPTEEALRDEYVQAVARDDSTSPGVKVAMVMGSFYESSGKHIGRPYVDKLGKGQPLTVCNGITGAVAKIDPNHYYTPAECYRLERGVYLQSEREAKSQLRYWVAYDPFVQGTFIDFVHHKGGASLSTSTMRAKANAGDLEGACRETPRWNKGTVKGVKTVLPGMQLRGESNDEICREWRLPG